jgi:hypothetical protein
LDNHTAGTRSAVRKSQCGENWGNYFPVFLEGELADKPDSDAVTGLSCTVYVGRERMSLDEVLGIGAEVIKVNTDDRVD